MSNARILIVEDDPHWVNTIKLVIEPLASFIDVATNLAGAQRYLEDRYYNVAIVDLSLQHGDPNNSDGMKFLALLRTLALNQTVRPIIFSAYGDMDIAIAAFRDYDVVNFLKKAPFEPHELQQAVENALQQNHLNRPLALRVAGHRDLRQLLEEFNWARREDPFQLEPEFYDLLRRLFPIATRLFIKTLPAGQSGAGILDVEPGYQDSVGKPVIVKFGKRDKTMVEKQNYDQFVEPYVSAQSSTQLGCETARIMGAISYRLIGTELGAVDTFAAYYARNKGEDICTALSNLFSETCALWYENRNGPREQHNLVELYECDLHMIWDEVWAGATTLNVDLAASHLQFPGIRGRFINPKPWLAAHADRLYLPIWQAITHGDLNAYNILVTADKHCWLIDFYRSGRGHILRDVIELETAIKFDLTAYAELDDFRALETHLLQQTQLDDPILPESAHPYAKPLAVIGHLRKQAYLFTGHARPMREYNVGLLLTTLNLLRLDFLRAAFPAVLLSAALLCEWLDKDGV